jgi:hypothetical protein
MESMSEEVASLPGVVSLREAVAVVLRGGDPDLHGDGRTRAHRHAACRAPSPRLPRSAGARSATTMGCRRDRKRALRGGARRPSRRCRSRGDQWCAGTDRSGAQPAGRPQGMGDQREAKVSCPPHYAFRSRHESSSNFRAAPSGRWTGTTRYGPSLQRLPAAVVRITILRHAFAGHKGTFGGPDEGRMLDATGERDAEHLVAALT